MMTSSNSTAAAQLEVPFAIARGSTAAVTRLSNAPFAGVTEATPRRYSTLNQGTAMTIHSSGGPA